MPEAWEVWNELLERPTGQLTATEQSVYLVNVLLIDVENGSWLYNLSPDLGDPPGWQRLRAAATAAGVVGLSELSRSLSDLADCLEPLGPTWRDRLETADPDGTIVERVTAESHRAWAGLERFTCEHLGAAPPQHRAGDV